MTVPMVELERPIARLPQGWSAAPLWALASCNDEVLPETTDPESTIRYIEISDVNEIHGVTGSTDVIFGKSPSRARRKVKQGDVILSTVRTYLRAVAAIDSEYAGSVVSTGFAVIRPRKLHPGFLRHVVASDFFIEEVIARSVGVSYPAINASDVMKLKIPVPPFEEQCRIAAFLDNETARIDELVREQQRLRDHLIEKSEATVTNAVLFGLAGNAGSLPDVNTWPPPIPRHWQSARLKTIVKNVKSGVSVNADNEPGGPGESVVLKTSSISRGRFLPGENKRILGSEVQRAACPVTANTVLMSRMNTPSLVGDSAYVAEDMPVHFLPDRLWKISFLPGAHVPYFARVLSTTAIRSLLSALSMGTSASMKNISQEQVLNQVVPIPPLEEQIKIAEALDKQDSTSSSLVNEVKDSARLLLERRSALISAAVTGQLDLRDWQLPEPEAVAEVA